MEEEASGKVELRAGQALWMTRNDHLAAQELAAVFGERPGQLLNMPTGDGPGDDQPLDFRRALEDRVDLRIPVPPLDGEVADVAVAAEDLDGFVGDGRRRRL